MAVFVAVLGTATTSGAQLTISWIDNSGGVAAFSVERRPGSGTAFATIANIPPGVTSYTDTSVPQGSTYCYRVLAYDGDGVSPYSNEACSSLGTTVTVSKAGTGTGAVNSTPAGINCGTACAATYPAGTSVTLVGTPDPGSIFTGWSGGGCAGTAPCTFAGNAPIAVTAIFAASGTGTPPAPPPPSQVALSVTYVGKLRDRVGQSNTALGSDGALDGTLTATLRASGGRTVTALKLEGTGPGTWDTAADSGFWALGVATALNAPLINPTTKTVNFAVPDGGTFVLFASDWAGTEFVLGTTLTLTATFSDGTTASATTTIGETAVPALSVTFNGTLRDRVGQSNTALSADGALDGTLTAMLSASGGRTVTALRLEGTAPGTWDTDAGTGFWALGVATAFDAPLINDPATKAVNVAVPDGGTFVLFASDWAGTEFVPGTTLTLTATFSDGTTTLASTTIGETTAPALSVIFNGKLRDRVGQSNTALSADGALDGTLTATLRASGGRTVTALKLEGTAPGTWDTDAGSAFWVLGVAAALDTPLINNPATKTVNFTVPDGGTFVLFASDWAGTEFVPGTTLTVTATFSDGTTATAATTVGGLTLTYKGKLRDRVGQGNTALSADGALDGTLTATLRASGGRTVTALKLEGTGPGTWDTYASSDFWVLGVAAALDASLINNPATKTVNFTVPDGGTFVLFASDWAGTEFVPGTTLTLTATFSDGTTATATTTVEGLTVTYNGRLRDRVGQSNMALNPDGAPDGTLIATLGATGGRTVTALKLEGTGPGTWDTDAGSDFWVLGVATGLDAPLINNPATKIVNFAVPDGGTFVLFASDWAGTEFVQGTTFILTATFSDGTTTTAVTRVP